MSGLLRHFQTRRWKRLVLTSGLAAVLGLLTTLLTYPHIRDYLIIHRLESQDAAVREKAIITAAALAERSPRTLQRLIKALRTENDRQFTAIVASLRKLGRFETPQQEPNHIDRMRAITLAETRSRADPQAAAHTRWMILIEILLSGRDNGYVRRALTAAAGDESKDVRACSALLAARVGDDTTLSRLLTDDDPTVVAAGALAAGIAGRGRLYESISKLLNNSSRTDVVSSAAFAMARLAPAESSTRICRLMEKAEDEALRDRLLHVATMLNDENARRAIREIITSTSQAKRHSTAMVFLAAGKLGVDEITPPVKNLLKATLGPNARIPRLKVLAALQAADMLDLNVTSEAHAFCRRLWATGMPLTLSAAARLIGKTGKETTSLDRKQMLQTLRSATCYSQQAPGQPQSDSVSTPLPSAAAAVAMWRLEPETAKPFIKMAAAAETTLPGDYLAWHLGHTGGSEAFALGQAMLPAQEAPQHLRVYNDNERACGAMLLALSARTEEQKEQAVKRISSRLVGGPLGGEDRFHVAGSYRCALLILGREDLNSDVRELLQTGQFPLRRAITSLCAAGNHYALRWLLWNPAFTDKDIASLLVDLGIGEVLAACAPGLPSVDAAAGEDLQNWQVRILRDYYAIHAADIKLGLFGQ